MDDKASHRLDSWKEIAAFLKRDVRTVQRWEASQGLPVRRRTSRKTGSVYAFEHEIEKWLKGGQIHAKLSGQSLPERRESRSPRAHEAYLKGRYLWNKRTPEALFKALDYFQEAIRIDRGYALAHAAIADVYLVLGGVILGVMAPQEGMPKARMAATRALELDDRLGQAHAALAFVTWMFDYDWKTAEKEFQTAIALSPQYATARHWRAVCLAHQGRHREAQVEIERARRLDPLSLQINAAVVQVFYFGRAYGRAIEHARKAIDLDPNFATTHLMMAVAYKEKGMFDDALAEANKALAYSNRSAPCLACVGGCHAAAGRKQEAEKILEELQGLRAQKYVDPYVLAWVHASLHDAERTLVQLEEAYARQSSYIAAIKVDPALDFLRSDSRFQSIQRDVGVVAWSARHSNTELR